MEKKLKRKIFENLLIELIDSRPDLDKHKGNPVPAEADRVATVIEKMQPYAHLFEDSFKLKVQEYLTVGKEAVKGNQAMSVRLTQLIRPMNNLIKETLEKNIMKLS